MAEGEIVPVEPPPEPGSTTQLDERRDGCVGLIMAIGGFLVGTLYILNPTGGVIEFIPDNLPLIGNLDEAGAAAMVVYSLQYLGRRFRGGS